MGNAICSNLTTKSPTVHPHVHGERRSAWAIFCGPGGSSPRTWGTLRPDIVPVVDPRFIPTYMGNASFRVVRETLVPVHPHVHGERTLVATHASFHTGSSPRTWGTQSRQRRRGRYLRFIPTYMGNAKSALFVGDRVTVHPHVHGERSGFRPLTDTKSGSSPRTWGTLLPEVVLHRLPRFIPTYMGNAAGNRKRRA